MSERYIIEDRDTRFDITDTHHHLIVVTVNKKHMLGSAVQADALAVQVRSMYEGIHAEQEQTAENRKTLNAYLAALTPYELATLAQSVRKGDKLFTPDQL